MQENKPFDHSSLSRLIAERITEEIITGKLKAGDKLTEVIYAQEYGTSRAPIREAFYLLAIDGLVDRIPRKGSIVKGYSERDIGDLLEIRLMLENLAMDRIAVWGTNESILEHMEQLVGEMDAAEGDRLLYTSLNQQFHLNIIKMSESEIIANMYAKLGLPLFSLQRLSFKWEEDMHSSLQEHRMIVHYLRRRQFQEAKQILLKHNQAISNRILKIGD